MSSHTLMPTTTPTSSGITPNTLQPTRVQVRSLRALKNQRGISMLTAYDAPTAALLDRSGVDLILVGDSVGTVLLGYDSTLPVTLEDILHHTRAVVRGVRSATQRSMVIADLPFMSYQVSDEQALVSAGRLIQEAGAQAVKLEGGAEYATRIQKLVQAGIPVMGHIGLMPQSVLASGGYRTYGKSDDEAHALMESARALQASGVFSIVLECVLPEVAAQITQALAIPVIGIGSGSQVDGQVLVLHDLVGLTEGHVPKFVTPTAHLRPLLTEAVRAFVARSTQPSTRAPLTTEPAPKQASGEPSLLC